MTNLRCAFFSRLTIPVIMMKFFQDIIFFLAFVAIPLHAIDNPHFYRATFFWGEPRLERPWLTTFEVEVATGRTNKSFNNNGDKTPLLNIFGPEAFWALGKNVPNLDPTNPLDQILINLAQLPASGTFGDVVFGGHFRFFEMPMQVYQNIINGFFFQAHIPVRRLLISNIRMTDISPQMGPLTMSTPEWVAFLQFFDQILARYHLAIKPIDSSGVGDLSLLGGWARTYQQTCLLDYIDVSAKIGVLLPTGASASLHNPFSLPLGYNGHIGVPLKFDCSCGYLEWLTFGTHLGALFLIEKKEKIRMKTSPEQNGFILLTEGEAVVDPGTYWDAAVYTKADHFFRGLSLLFGYTYTHKDADCLRPKNKMVFNPAVVNHDARLRPWSMHELHFMFEYDCNFTVHDKKPIISLFYNMIVGGKNIFATTAKTARLSINLAWCY
jgi:hypothetical protein